MTFLFFCGCAGSLITSSCNAEKNRINMLNVKQGMTQNDVVNIMGRPYKVTKKSFQNKQYEIWYYLTKGAYLAQSEYIDENFTPFVFYLGYLKGIGDKDYNLIFNIDNAQQKKEEAEKREEKYKKTWPNKDNQDLENFLNKENENSNAKEIDINPQQSQQKQATPKTEEKAPQEKQETLKSKNKEVTPKTKKPKDESSSDDQNYNWWE